MIPKRIAFPLLATGAIFIAAIATGSLLLNQPAKNGSREKASSVYILGPARALLSDNLFIRADIYFHKGAPRHKEEAFHGFFQKWKEIICPVEHAHTEGDETKEILPWIRLATQSNPHNIEAYLVASFWLNGDCGRPDLALNTIQEAIEKNPKHYELYLETGRIHLSTDDYKSAATALQHALNLITRPNQSNPEQAAIDLSFIYMARSYLFELLDNREGAILATERFLELRPGQHFSDRLDKLQSEPLDPEAAKARLHELFHKTHQCDRDEHEHHGEHDCGSEHCEHHENSVQ